MKKLIGKPVIYWDLDKTRANVGIIKYIGSYGGKLRYHIADIWYYNIIPYKGIRQYEKFIRKAIIERDKNLKE